MGYLIEVDEDEYKKGIKARETIETIEKYLNENQLINGNEMRRIVGLPKIDRWGDFKGVVKKNLESD